MLLPCCAECASVTLGVDPALNSTHAGIVDWHKPAVHSLRPPFPTSCPHKSLPFAVFATHNDAMFAKPTLLLVACSLMLLRLLLLPSGTIAVPVKTRSMSASSISSLEASGSYQGRHPAVKALPHNVDSLSLSTKNLDGLRRWKTSSVVKVAGVKGSIAKKRKSPDGKAGSKNKMAIDSPRLGSSMPAREASLKDKMAIDSPPLHSSIQTGEADLKDKMATDSPPLHSSMQTRSASFKDTMAIDSPRLDSSIQTGEAGLKNEMAIDSPPLDSGMQTD